MDEARGREMDLAIRNSKLLCFTCWSPPSVFWLLSVSKVMLLTLAMMLATKLLIVLMLPMLEMLTW